MVTESVFSSSVVCSVEDFRSLFTPNSSDRLLLCYEAESDGVTSEDLTVLEDAVRSAAERHATKVQLHFWDCSSNAFEAVKRQLEKEIGTPLLLVVYKQNIADTLREPLCTMLQSVVSICERLATYQRGGKATSVSSFLPLSSSVDASSNGLRMTVDVSRLFGIGKQLMLEGKPEYAEKFFKRALGALDAVAPQCAEDSSMSGSTALCLAWTGLARIVQGRSACELVHRLKTDYAAFCTEVGSDVARVLTTHVLVSAVPLTWRSDICSQKRLLEVLAKNPNSHDHRCALVVTLFLSGDLERCLTEAVKLHTLRIPFGSTAIAAVCDFIGQDHPLVWKTVGVNPEVNRMQ